jgi:molybdenum cofactor cytidylyltransferase
VNLAGILLAAGASTRLGFPKQLIRFEGETLIRRAAGTLLAAGCRPVVVVLGAHADRLRPEIADLPVTSVLNPDWGQGMASSIRAGLTTALTSDPDLAAVLIALCDQPRVTTADLLDLLALYEAAGQPIAAAAHGHTLGVPAIFSSALFPELLSLKGEAGARRIIAAHHLETAPLTLPAAALDIDTAADLAPDFIAPGTCG